MVWLWAVTAFSATTAAVTGLGWAVASYRLSRLRWANELAARAKTHQGAFHRCPYHHDTDLYNAPEPHQRVDLTEIGERNRKLYQSRTD